MRKYNIRHRVNIVKNAFITGITGQDGPYMAELLLANGYESKAGCGEPAPSKLTG